MLYDIIATYEDGTTEELHLTPDELRYLDCKYYDIAHISNENPMEDMV